MDLFLDPGQRDVIGALLAAAATVSGILVISWPYLVGDRVGARMRRLASEREQIRRDARSTGAPRDAVSDIRRRGGSLLRRMFDRLGLDRTAGAAATVQKLQTAGLRSRSAPAVYLAARAICPVVASAAAFLFQITGESTAALGAQTMSLTAAAGVLGFFVPTIYLKNRIQKRQQAMQRAWPDALDLMLICVQSGMAIEPALQKVSEEIGAQSIDLAEELSLTTAEMSFLPDRMQAYANLARRTGLDCVHAFVTTLKQAEKQGASVSRALRVLAQESRDTRLSLAEKKAAALPPKLTVPMIVFFLPILFVVIVTPAAIQLLDAI